MPEGDTVHLAARRLARALTGQRLTKTDFRVPGFATSDLSGQVLTEIDARGKHLLFRTDAGITIHSHFKMEGRWDLHRPGTAWSAKWHHIRAVLETDPWVAVGSRLGIVELLPTAEEERAVGHLGPDPLGPDWDPEEAVRRLERAGDRPISEVLLDQTVIAGPGNIYKSELMFLRGLHPQTPASQIGDVPALVSLTKRVMEANRDTGRQVTTGETRPGRRHWVYGRAGRPCRRCGAIIRSVMGEGNASADRVTYWCPSCQPAR